MIPFIRQLVLAEERDLEHPCALLLAQNKAACEVAFAGGEGAVDLLVRCMEASQKARGHLAAFYLAKRDNDRGQMLGSMAEFTDACASVRCITGTLDMDQCRAEIQKVLLSRRKSEQGLPIDTLITEAEAARAARLATYEARQAAEAAEVERQREAYRKEEERRAAARAEMEAERKRQDDAVWTRARASPPVRNLSWREEVDRRVARFNGWDRGNRSGRLSPIEGD